MKPCDYPTSVKKLYHLVNVLSEAEILLRDAISNLRQDWTGRDEKRWLDLTALKQLENCLQLDIRRLHELKDGFENHYPKQFMKILGVEDEGE